MFFCNLKSFIKSCEMEFSFCLNFDLAEDTSDMQNNRDATKDSSKLGGIRSPSAGLLKLLSYSGQLKCCHLPSCTSLSRSGCMCVSK